jgi:hypothetical protein
MNNINLGYMNYSIHSKDDKIRNDNMYKYNINYNNIYKKQNIYGMNLIRKLKHYKNKYKLNKNRFWYIKRNYNCGVCYSSTIFKLSP